MKKIISFSLWGNDPRYLVGARENLCLQKTIYPEWVCRYYIDDTVPVEIIKYLGDNGAEVVPKERSDHYKGLFWRFEPGYDETIERFIVRDCDSRLNIREAAAVKEWEESNLAFHCMRDHYHHTGVMGAMWGAIALFIPNYKQVLTDFMSKLDSVSFIRRDKYFQTDQDFLNHIIWPKVADNSLCHDDSKRVTGKEIPFKVKLPQGLFIGQQYKSDNRPYENPV